MKMEAITLLYQMIKNRPEGMNRKECLLALSEPDIDKMLDEIREDLFRAVSDMTDEEFGEACISSVRNHLEE